MIHSSNGDTPHRPGRSTSGGRTPFLARLTVVRGTQFPRLSGLLRRFARSRHRIGAPPWLFGEKSSEGLCPEPVLPPALVACLERFFFAPGQLLPRPGESR